MRRCGTPTSTTHPGVNWRQKLVTDRVYLLCKEAIKWKAFQRYYYMRNPLWNKAIEFRLTGCRHDLTITWTTVSLAPVFSAAEQALQWHQVRRAFATSSTEHVKFWWCVDSFNRSLELYYPHFPTEQDFIHSVLSSGDICSYTQKGELYLLGRFALEWPRLQAGGLLLSDLVEFYKWLHTALGKPALGDGKLLCQLLHSYWIHVQMRAVLKTNTH